MGRGERPASIEAGGKGKRRRKQTGWRWYEAEGRRPEQGRPLTTASTRKAARGSALAALRARDRKLAALIDAIGPIDVAAWRRARPAGDAFSVLAYGIIGQQISGYAARAIAGRLQDRFGGRMPTPVELLAMDPADLKSVGLSRMKTEYLRSLAEHIVSGELDIDHLGRLHDDEVRRQITTVKGLGPWTADMFLLIHLQRPDVLSVGDLGIRQAVGRLYRLDHVPSPKEVEEIGEKWRPNRTLASYYLWESNRRPAEPKAGSARKPAANGPRREKTRSPARKSGKRSK